MAWWDKFFQTRRQAPSTYGAAFNLYCRDGKRGAEVRERRDGSWWFIDQEWVEGTTFKYRGVEIGPFETSDAAEAAATTRDWFNYGDGSKE
jgi:hypothetical protein